MGRGVHPLIVDDRSPTDTRFRKRDGPFFSFTPIFKVRYLWWILRLRQNGSWQAHLKTSPCLRGRGPTGGREPELRDERGPGNEPCSFLRTSYDLRRPEGSHVLGPPFPHHPPTHPFLPLTRLVSLKGSPSNNHTVPPPNHLGDKRDVARRGLPCTSSDYLWCLLKTPMHFRRCI